MKKSYGRMNDNPAWQVPLPRIGDGTAMHQINGTALNFYAPALSNK